MEETLYYILGETTSRIDEMMKTWSHYIPLEVLLFLIPFVEEFIPLIPSTLFIAAAGALAQAEGQPLGYLVWLSLFVAAGRTTAGLLLYRVGDKAEDVVMKRMGKLWGLSHGDIERIGARLDNSWKDFLTMLFFRSFPAIPSTPVSLVCGIIKYNVRIFAITTFLGSFILSLSVMYLTYAGVQAYELFRTDKRTYSLVVSTITLSVLVAVGVWVYRKIHALRTKRARN